MLASLPDWLDPLWAILYDSLALLAVALVLLAVARRRPAVLLAGALSVALAAVVTVVSARLAVGRWPELDDSRAAPTSMPRRSRSCAWRSPRRSSSPSSPHLVRPLQRVVRWIARARRSLGGVLVEAAAPSGDLAALARRSRRRDGRPARVRHLGRPSGDRRRDRGARRARRRGRAPRAGRPAAGRRLRRARASTAAASRCSSRSTVATPTTRSSSRSSGGRRCTATTARACAAAGSRRSSTRRSSRSSRSGQACRRASPRRRRESSTGDAVLVLHDPSRPSLDAPGEPIDDALLAGRGAASSRSEARGIAHHRIEPDTLAIVRRRGRARRLRPRDDRRATASTSSSTARSSTRRSPPSSASSARSRPRVPRSARTALAALLPYLQPAALRPRAPPRAAARPRSTSTTCATQRPRRPAPTRRRSSGCAASPGGRSSRSRSSRSPSRRSSARSAGSTTATSPTPSDGASWGWVAAGFVARAAAARSRRPSRRSARSRRASRSGPVYAMQLATGYLNLALPSNLARMAINIRFFQRQGVPPATAVTAGRDRLVRLDGDAGAAARRAAPLLEASLEPSARHARPGRRPCALLAVVAHRRGRARRRRRARAAAPQRDRRAGAPLVAGRAGDARRASAPPTSSASCSAAASRPSCSSRSALGVFANAFGYDVSLADLLADQHLGLAARDASSRSRAGSASTEFGLTRRADGGGHAGGGRARGRRPLPARDLLPPAASGASSRCAGCSAMRTCRTGYRGVRGEQVEAEPCGRGSVRRAARGRCCRPRRAGARTCRGRPFPGETVTMPPPMPLLPGRPMSQSQSPEVSYSPAVVITASA